jgi:glycosyltransferase involved in cell wall biosynthesis
MDTGAGGGKSNHRMGSTGRILLLVTDLEIGGTPTVVRELAVRLHREGVRVRVACLGKWGPVASQIEAAGVEVKALGASSARDLRVVGRAIELVRDYRSEVVLSFLLHANAVAAVASVFTQQGRFFQSIQTTQPTPRWHWQVQRMIAPLAERIIVPSNSVAEVARRWSGIAREQIVVIPNAVEVGEYAGLAGVALEVRPFPIGFIGRLDPIKRIGDLVEAVARLEEQVHLHIFGEGPERSRIEAQVARLGLGGRVTLHGAIDDPREALSRIGLLVLPSAAEGFGLVLIEAMAAGVPVVATDVAGIRDVVVDGKTGVLVPVASPVQLREAIGRVMRDPQLRGSLTSRAREDVARRFSWAAVLPIYREVLGI